MALRCFLSAVPSGTSAAAPSFGCSYASFSMPAGRSSRRLGCAVYFLFPSFPVVTFLPPRSVADSARCRLSIFFTAALFRASRPDVGIHLPDNRARGGLGDGPDGSKKAEACEKVPAHLFGKDFIAAESVVGSRYGKFRRKTSRFEKNEQHTRGRFEDGRSRASESGAAYVREGLRRVCGGCAAGVRRVCGGGRAGRIGKSGAVRTSPDSPAVVRERVRYEYMKRLILPFGVLAKGSFISS